MALQMALPARAQRFVKYVDSMQGLKDLNTADVHSSVFVRGYYAPEDGGEGFFWWNSSDSTSTNRGTIVKGKTTGAELSTGRWNRVASAITPSMFGAKADGSDDAVYVTDWLNTAWPGGHFVPDKIYSFGNITPTSTAGRRIWGPGTWKKRTAETGQWIIWSVSKLTVEGITFDGNHGTRTLWNFSNYCTNVAILNCKIQGVQNNASTGISTDTTDCFVAGKGSREFSFKNDVFYDIDSTYAPGAGTSGERCIRFGIVGGGSDWTNDRFDNIRVVDCTFDTIGPAQLDADPVVFQNQIPDANGDQLANILIKGNLFRNCGRRFIKLECGGAVVTENDCYSTRTGTVAADGMFSAISVYGPKTIVSNNKIHGGTYNYCIDVTWLTTFGQPHGCQVTGNIIDARMSDRTSSRGIALKGAKQCTVTGNVIYGVEYGIQVGGNCEDIGLENNDTDHIATYGIVVQALTAGTGESYTGTPNAINISGGVVNSDQYSIFLSAATDCDVSNVKGTAGTQFYFRNTGITGMSFFGKRVETAASDQAITSSTTLTDATGLVVTLVANRKYRYRAVLFIDNAGTAAGVKLAMTGPASPTKATLYGVLENATGTIVHQAATAYATIIAQGIATTGVKYAIMEGTVFNGANGGDLKVQFAQNTSDGNATTLKAGSFLEVERIN